MPNQPIKLPNVEYEMVIELAKKARLKPEQYLAKLISDEYGNKR